MNNPYSLLLKEYIAQSGLSLTEIENNMRKRGLNKNKAYLSSLQNGKMPPPPLNVTQALCDITGGDPLRLSLTGVLMEISEQDFFLINKDINKLTPIDAIKEIIVTTIATLTDINKYKLSQQFRDFFNDNGLVFTEEEVLEVLTYKDTKEILDQVLEMIPLNEFNEAFKKGVNASSPEEAKEIMIEVTRNIDFKKKSKLEANYIDGEITDEEFDYLMHCLVVYRKLNLKPFNS